MLFLFSIVFCFFCEVLAMKVDLEEDDRVVKKVVNNIVRNIRPSHTMKGLLKV